MLHNCYTMEKKIIEIVKAQNYHDIYDHEEFK